MKSIHLPLLGLAPDADPTMPGVLTACMGTVPSIRGLKGAPGAVSAGMATLAATCIGAALVTKLDGTTRLFAGTGTKLYEAQSSTWGDVSRAATYTGTVSTSRWRFAQQENVSIAANGANTIQASVSTGAFSCVAGAPIAAIVQTVNKFVMAANLSTASNGIAWSAINDYSNWTASTASQAGNTTLTSTPGAITALRAFGSLVVAFKKNSMYLGTYQGPPVVWQFDLIPGSSAGALSQETVVNIGTGENPKLIFMGEDDFYLFDGSKPIPIGTNRIKESVFSTTTQARFYACSALHDRTNNRVYFYYPVSDSQLPDKCVVYNYRTDKWGRDDRQIEATTDFIAPSVSYNGLGAVYATYNDLPSSAYDNALVGSTKIFPAIFDTTHSLKTLTGPCVSSTITTGDLGDDQGFSTLTRLIPRFITSPTTATLTHFYKNGSGNTLTQGVTTSLSSFGQWFDLILSARWHRFQMSFTGDWELSAISPEWEIGETE